MVVKGFDTPSPGSTATASTISSVIVFRVVKQCPLVHVPLRGGDPQITPQKPPLHDLRPFSFCPQLQLVLSWKCRENSPGDVMTEAARHDKPEKPRKSSWWWPAGVVASGLAGAAAVAAFRGCWHSKMSWPVRVQGCSYQVCLRCGAMRLFDEQTFSAYGPFRNDLNQLRAWQKSEHRGPRPEAMGSARP